MKNPNSIRKKDSKLWTAHIKKIYREGTFKHWNINYQVSHLSLTQSVSVIRVLTLKLFMRLISNQTTYFKSIIPKKKNSTYLKHKVIITAKLIS